MTATPGNPLSFRLAGPPAAQQPHQAPPAEGRDDEVGGRGFIASFESHINDRAGERADDDAPTFALSGADAPRPLGLVVRSKAGPPPVEGDAPAARPQDLLILFPEVRPDAGAAPTGLAKGGAETVHEIEATIGEVDTDVRLRAHNLEAPIFEIEGSGAASAIPDADFGKQSAPGRDVAAFGAMSEPSTPDLERRLPGISASSDDSAPPASNSTAPVNNHANAAALAQSAIHAASESIASAPAAPAASEAAPAEVRPSVNPNPAQHLVASPNVGHHFAVSAIARPNDNVIEVRLDPPELGKITIEFSDLGSAGIKATVSADLPATLDFLRRHADQLTLELERRGFSGADLSFSDKGADDSTLFDRKRAPARAIGFVAAASAPAHAAIEAVITTAYDRTV